MNVIKLNVLFFFLTFSFSLFSQEPSIYTSKFVNLYSERCRLDNYQKSNRPFLLGFYSRYISSQDRSECLFYPSCSVYMSESVKKAGIIIGILKGLDRLARCNGIGNKQYEYTYDHKMIDLP
jgi:putative component of membrane protein insertase Oxa1/YidC/SpoIIIJ protein YidD